MNIKIVSPNSPLLKKVCEEITGFNGYQEIVNTIVKLLENRAYAGAAPQFGINKRFIVVVNTNEIKDRKDPITHTINA